jgi:hypothetical protein
MAIDDFEIERQDAQTADYVIGAPTLVSRTLSIWARKFPRYLQIGIILFIFSIIHEVVLFGFFMAPSSFVAREPTAFAWNVVYEIISSSDPFSLLPLIIISLILMLIGFVITSFIIGATVKFAFDDYGTSDGNVSTAVSFSFARLVSLILIQFILGLFLNIFLQPATIMLNAALESMDIELMAQVILPVYLLLFIYLYISARLIPVTAVLIAEDLSVLDSFKRSIELTSGKFFHILGGVILYFIAYFAIVLGLSMISLTLEILLGDLGYLIGYYLTQLIVFPLVSIFGVVLYRDLSSRPEKAAQEAQEYW